MHMRIHMNTHAHAQVLVQIHENLVTKVSIGLRYTFLRGFTFKHPHFYPSKLSHLGALKFSKKYSSKTPENPNQNEKKSAAKHGINHTQNV
jgi:hypothetical protein